MEAQDIISNSSQSVFQKMGKYTYLMLFIVLVLLVLIIYYYNSYIGKYVKRDLSGFRKLLNSGETEVDNVEISMGYSPPLASNEKPSDDLHPRNKNKKGGKGIHHFNSANDDSVEKKQVFNISDNVYSYFDAMALCKAYDSELATAKQMKEAYDNKAEWCNYGWTEGQLALYPTQKETWDKLQQGPKKHRNDCGKPGLNGGYFENPYLKFGVNCYGNKPKPTRKEKEIIKLSTNPYLTQKEKEFNERVDYYKSQRYDTTILPFSKNTWSKP